MVRSLTAILEEISSRSPRFSGSRWICTTYRMSVFFVRACGHVSALSIYKRRTIAPVALTDRFTNNGPASSILFRSGRACGLYKNVGGHMNKQAVNVGAPGTGEPYAL